MNLNDFNQSKYLAGRELPEGGLDLVIARFESVVLNDGTSKPAVHWSNPAIKPMLLNKTNRMRLEALFRTSQTEALIGQRVGVFFDRMVVGPTGEMVGGLRLRPANTVPAAPLGYQPGHQPNPAAGVVRERLQPPVPPQTVQDVAGDWTQEVPF